MQVSTTPHFPTCLNCQGNWPTCNVSTYTTQEYVQHVCQDTTPQYCAAGTASAHTASTPPQVCLPLGEQDTITAASLHSSKTGRMPEAEAWQRCSSLLAGQLVAQVPGTLLHVVCSIAGSLLGGVKALLQRGKVKRRATEAGRQGIM